jgi:type VI secretion system protein ImpF
MPGRNEEREEELTVLERLMWQEDRADDMGRRGDGRVDSIARDLEILMNCRREAEPILEEYPEVSKSILNFGMPALGRYGHIGTAAEQSRLCRAMEEAVRTFEPRLRRPQVRVREAGGEQQKLVRFVLEATIDGFGQREIFELRLKPSTGEMTVATGGGA